MSSRTIFTLAASGLLCLGAAGPVLAQQTEGDATSRLGQWARNLAPPGTFWLDSNEDREIIRYTTPRDVRLCLPRPSGVGSAERGYPLRITWDSSNSVILYPGNCLFFDARRVTVKPASELPSNIVLEGHVEVARALVGQ